MRRVVLAKPIQLLPLQLEEIGINPDQEMMNRPQGYPVYHWLHTIDGEGEIVVAGKTWRLPIRTGILLAPGIPHRYEAKNGCWQTGYITFQGSAASSFIQAFGWGHSRKFQWEISKGSISSQFEELLNLAEAGADPSGWHYSANIYRFLTLLHTDAAHADHRPSMSKRLERIQTLLDWLDTEFPNPSIGLAEMAAQLGIGERQLNERFRELFGISAYAYLIQLRLRKAKEWLPARPEWTVKRIGEAVGFRDPSHFVATFRQKEGMTPETYRKLHYTGSNIIAED